MLTSNLISNSPYLSPIAPNSQYTEKSHKYGQRYGYVSSRKYTQLPKSCVISCTNAHPLHICLIASWNHSHFPNSPRQWTLQLHTVHRQPLLSLLFQALSHLCQLLLAHLFHPSDALSQPPSTFSREWPSLEAGTPPTPAEHAHPTWPSSNTTTGLICSPCETSSLYFPSWPLLSPDLYTLCNNFWLFCELALVQSRNKYIWKSIILPPLAEASLALCCPGTPDPQTPLQLLRVSPGSCSPSGDRDSPAQNSALPPLLCRALTSIQEWGSQKIPEGLLWCCETRPLAFLPAGKPPHPPISHQDSLGWLFLRVLGSNLTKTLKIQGLPLSMFTTFWKWE